MIVDGVILDGVNLLDIYKWRLTWMDGHLDQTERKNVMKHRYLEASPFKHDAKKITYTLIQKFASEALMTTGVGYIKTLLLNNAVHTVEVPRHGIAEFNAVVRDGATVSINGLIAEMKITFTVVYV